MPTGVYQRTERNRHSPETIEKLRRMNTGASNPRFGKTGTDKQKEAARRMMIGNKRALGFRFSTEQLEHLSTVRRGTTRSAETRKKMSLAAACSITEGRRVIPSGEKHWNYKKDRSLLAKKQERNDSAYKEWRRSVRNRDGWRCQIADGSCSGKVIAHHILPWRGHVEERYQVSNGITLCRSHHPMKKDDEIKLAPIFQNIVANNSK